MPPSAAQLVAGLHRLLYEWSTEERLTWAGLKDESETAAIGKRYRWLFSDEAIQAARASRDRAGEPDARERASRLFYALVETRLFATVAPLADELTNQQLGMSATVDGEEIPFFSFRPKIGVEPDFGRRERLVDANLGLIARTVDLAQEILGRMLAELYRLTGYTSYQAYCQDRKLVDYAALSRALEQVAAETERVYQAAVGEWVQRVIGRSMNQVRHGHTAFLLKQPEFDPLFPKEHLLPVASRALRRLGFDLAALPNIHVDAEERPKKNPRACCFDADPPREVHLLVRPIGGREDYAAFLHEAGHALHFGFTSSRLPFPYRQLGRSNGLTEIYAYLFEGLVRDPIWLEDELGLSRAQAEAVARGGRLAEMVMLRRYLGKFTYETEFFKQPLDRGRNAGLYTETLGRLTCFRYPPEQFLYDMDSGFYSADYLRAWLGEAQLRARLRERFGPRWFTRPEAGRFLVRLWRQGSRPDAEEILAAEGFQPFAPAHLLHDFDVLNTVAAMKD